MAWKDKKLDWQRNYVKTEKGYYVTRAIGKRYGITLDEYRELKKNT